MPYIVKTDGRLWFVVHTWTRRRIPFLDERSTRYARRELNGRSV